jgi:hypothetical protein
MGAPSRLPFQLDQNFFGFKPADQVQFHDSIFNMLWHGEGRWDWDTIYNMPIHIRNRWITNLNNILHAKHGTNTNNSSKKSIGSKNKK